MRLKAILILAALLTAPACAKKDAPSCVIPADLPRPMLEGPSSEQPRQIVPVVRYVLALSWSPQYCASRMTNPADRLQCGGEAGHFGFILHGLWPDGEGQQSPQYCKPARLVPDKVVRAMLCSTPSVRLIQHEWEKHGTCVASDPAKFFEQGRSLYQGLSFPDMAAMHGKPVTAGAFQQSFAAANKGMTADMVKVEAKDGWLQGVKICLDKGLKRQSCPADEGGSTAGALINIR